MKRARSSLGIPSKLHTRRILSGDGTEIDEILSTSPRWAEILDTERARPASRTLVGELMQRDVLCVRPDLSVETLARLFVERGISGAPVVDEDARLLGFVSLAEIVRDSVESGGTLAKEPLKVPLNGGGEYQLPSGYHAEEIAHTTVGAIMTQSVVTLSQQESLARAAALMTFEDVRQIPVIDDDRRVLGLISALDLSAWLASSSGFLVPEHQRARHRPGTHD